MDPDNFEESTGGPSDVRPARRRLAVVARLAFPALAIVLLMLWVLGVFRRGRIEPGALPPPAGASLPENCWPCSMTGI